MDGTAQYLSALLNQDHKVIAMRRLFGGLGGTCLVVAIQFPLGSNLWHKTSQLSLGVSLLANSVGKLRAGTGPGTQMAVWLQGMVMEGKCWEWRGKAAELPPMLGLLCSWRGWHSVRLSVWHCSKSRKLGGVLCDHSLLFHASMQSSSG